MMIASIRFMLSQRLGDFEVGNQSPKFFIVMVPFGGRRNAGPPQQAG